RPLRHPPFPYTTLFRSRRAGAPQGGSGRRARPRERQRDLLSGAGRALLPARARALRWLLGARAAGGWADGPARASGVRRAPALRSEEHTSELQSLRHLV